MALNCRPGPGLPGEDGGGHTEPMRLRDLLRWIRHRETESSAAERDRYDDAERTEEETQAHYRSVTDTDARGRSTKKP